MSVDFMSKLQQLRRKNRDWLLTLLTAVLTLMIFVFAPLQAAGFFLFHAFAFLFELCHPDINRLRRYRSRAPLGAKSLQCRKHHWPTLSGDDFGQACNPRIESG